MKATVRLAPNEPDHPPYRGTPREVECAVRLGHLGYGSVEIDAVPLDHVEEWRTLGELLQRPEVLGVTFSGPWDD